MDPSNLRITEEALKQIMADHEVEGDPETFRALFPQFVGAKLVEVRTQREAALINRYIAAGEPLGRGNQAIIAWYTQNPHLIPPRSEEPHVKLALGDEWFLDIYADQIYLVAPPDYALPEAKHVLPPPEEDDEGVGDDWAHEER